METFLALAGVALVIWAISGTPLIKVNRKCNTHSSGYSADKPASQIGPIRARVPYVTYDWDIPRGYASAKVDRSEMKPPPANTMSTKPQGNHGTAPVAEAKPTESNVKPPAEGSGQSKMNLKKEDQ